MTLHDDIPKADARPVPTNAPARIVATARGGPEVLEPRPFSPAAPGPGELRIRTARAGVLLGDVFWQRGLIPGAPKPPFTPGYDAVGTVEAVGEGVTAFRPGDRVAALVEFGGYATHVVAPEAMAAPLPDALGWDAAAALVTPYVTAWQILVEVGSLAPGARVLVHGASGATGRALLDVARHRGLRVLGTASPHNHDAVRALGAIAIDYRAEAFEDAVAREMGAVDLVVDPIGGRHFDRSWSVLAPGGRLVATAAMAALGKAGTLETIAGFLKLPLRDALPNGRRAAMHDVVKHARSRDGAFADAFGAVADLALQGRIDPQLGETHPLEDAATAQARLIEGSARGRVVLDAG